MENIKNTKQDMKIFFGDTVTAEKVLKISSPPFHMRHSIKHE